MTTTKLTALTRPEFAQLAGSGDEDAPVATILLPMERKGAETRKNPIVFKNALAEAQAEWKRFGANHEPLRAALEELEPLASPTEEFWQHQENGIAMVVRGGEPVQACLVPFAVGPLSYVGKRPYLSPLLRLMDGSFYHVLVLDLDRLRLFRAGRWAVEEVELSGIPLGLEEAMQYDDPERSLQNRTVSSSNLPGAGGSTVAFHGHGVTGDEARKKKAKRFFEMVENGLAANLPDREAPLVLLGPDAEVGLYREVNHYPHLCEDDLRFNASNLSRDDLDRMICGWIEDREAEKRSETVTQLRNALGQGQASDDLSEVLKACADGRVATLFVKEDEFRYGVLDRVGDRLEIRETRESGDEELLGAAASKVALSGGEVCFVGRDDDAVGADKPLAAIMRY